jgi:hypothetical protein
VPMTMWGVSRTLALRLIAQGIVLMTGSQLFPMTTFLVALALPACAGEPIRPPALLNPVSAPTSLDDLARMTPAELDAIYAASPAASMPTGRVKGRPLVRPGTRVAVPASRVGRIFWQGKIFRADGATAVNRFVGVPFIKGELYQGTSWFDGQPALILDYANTSRIYRPYRDEIREVAPGLYLGRMYERTEPTPTQTLLFALDDRAR